jgi:hypothetical protein
MKNLVHVETPTHGYLVVGKNFFREVNADPLKISKYSGMNQHWLFLEEDCDARYFLSLLKEKNIPYSISRTDAAHCTSHNYNHLELTP